MAGTPQPEPMSSGHLSFESPHRRSQEITGAKGKHRQAEMTVLLRYGLVVIGIDRVVMGDVVRRAF